MINPRTSFSLSWPCRKVQVVDSDGYWSKPTSSCETIFSKSALPTDGKLWSRMPPFCGMVLSPLLFESWIVWDGQYQDHQSIENWFSFAISTSFGKSKFQRPICYQVSSQGLPPFLWLFVVRTWGGSTCKICFFFVVHFRKMFPSTMKITS